MEKLEFNKSITFFVGENGSGKSTLLEALAVAIQMKTGCPDWKSEECEIYLPFLDSSKKHYWILKKVI